MKDTNLAFDEVIENCNTIFLKKTTDYGTSWRVYRTLSVADQIYIKAKRIRNIQEGVKQQIDDDVIGEWKGIINYAIIGLIQLEINNDYPEELPVEKVKTMYADKVSQAKALMQSKNNDYGEAWRDMSQVSFVDLILAKILRIKQIISNDGITVASEGIDANFYDILNYAVFALILQKENE
jgi:hypothetical protein